MQNQKVNGIGLYFESADKKSAEQLAKAVDKSLQAISNTWQLSVPADCRVYLMDSWPRCVFLGAPLATQIYLGITLPLWYREFKMRWQYAGGWSQRYGARQVVGIKVPRLISEVPETMGESLFVREEDPEQKFLSIVCHELTHACSAHLDLPGWLNEGLAMVSVDRCLEKQTVLPNTIEMLRTTADDGAPSERIDLRTQSREQVILLYVRGYWLTRFLEETQSEFTQELLKTTCAAGEYESRIAEKLGMPGKIIWPQAGELLVDQYSVKTL
jgi:hypothetical protein